MSLEHFSLIESTLREGEQFINAFFTTDQKIQIARMLDAFGVEYIEMTTPCASQQSEADIRAITALNLNAKILTHTRCNLEDVKQAVDTGVDGVDVVIGTSSHLREFSHGKSIEEIITVVEQVARFMQDKNLEFRFSTEDTLRTEPAELVKVYGAVAELGVNRIGIADTVGIGNPRQIYDLVSTLRENIGIDVEFHGHNDTGCAIANAFAALEAGGTHIDVSVLGIGERNGITPLGGMIARLYAENPELVTKYDLHILKDLDELVAGILNLEIPFNNYLTGYSAFSHKAGIHTKAVLNNPSTYEVINPEAFALERNIQIAHRLTGWNAIRYRAQQLGLDIPEEALRDVTREIKSMSDTRNLSIQEVDDILHQTCRRIAVSDIKNAN